MMFSDFYTTKNTRQLSLHLKHRDYHLSAISFGCLDIPDALKPGLIKLQQL